MGSGWEDVMRTLVIADDLTGALEAAAVMHPDPVPVLWEAVPAMLPAVAVVNARTRDLGGQAAAQALSRWGGVFPGPARLAQKMDSRGRGHFASDAAALREAFARPYMLVAPALPVARRVVREGRIVVEGTVERDLLGAFETAGVPAAPWGPGRPLAQGVAAILDAASEADLRRGISAWPVSEHETLFVGSRGLLEILGAPKALPSPAFSGRILVLVGSPTASERGQLAALDRMLPVYGLDEASPIPPGRDAVLSSLGVRDASEEGIASAWRNTLSRLTGDAVGAVLVTGGKTAELLLEAVGACALTALGLWPHGAGVGRIVGGPWNGSLIVAKSGGFGPASALADLYQKLSALRREGATE